MAGTDDREARSDERAAETDDVEGHSLLERPPSEAPPAERGTDEGDDVEAHYLGERPPTERPPTE
jgi:hypothetical protein